MEINSVVYLKDDVRVLDYFKRIKPFKCSTTNCAVALKNQITQCIIFDLVKHVCIEVKMM